MVQVWYKFYQTKGVEVMEKNTYLTNKYNKGE